MVRLPTQLSSQHSLSHVCKRGYLSRIRLVLPVMPSEWAIACQKGIRAIENMCTRRQAGFDRFRSGTSGVQGVMVSCDVRAEGMCQAETVLALTDEAQDMYPELFAKEEEEDKAAGNIDDIEKAIEQEKKDAQKERDSVFAYIRTEVKGLIFVETKGAGMDPIAMVQGFIKKVRTQHIPPRLHLHPPALEHLPPPQSRYLQPTTCDWHLTADFSLDVHRRQVAEVLVSVYDRISLAEVLVTAYPGARSWLV